ncbi:unnamed protein product [Cuscuta campestris]|uniref:Calcineurin-like phosphoesterase domain-containing protein n=1 Tax=Cuscuta campestris TaxID=132261 RepID=A0A484MVZ6_9ASTE|nr:unnamed protein product [Cuscuta campestris]
MLRRFTPLAILFTFTGFIFAVRSQEFRPNLHRSRREITAARPERIGSIQVPPGFPFKIALFADLHFGENSWTAWGPQQDIKSVGVMSTVLDQEHPDFVIYLGDVITANNIPTKNASLYWEQAISPTRARRIPWASVFGNHDDMPFVWPLEWFSTSGVPPVQCPQNISYPGYKDCSFRGTTRLELMKYEVDHNTLSHSKCGPGVLWPSVSNYVLRISLTSDPDTAVAYMYFLDSGGGSYPEVISNAQVEWFNRTVQEHNPDARVPELMFWHIPSQDYHHAAADLSQHKTCVGSMFAEKVAAQEAEMGIMDLLERRSSVMALFVGHNHGLDWCCPYKKLWLCYARHTGYGGYGSWARGARILEITQHPFALKSWIRMENGTVHSEVILSSS